MSRDDAVRAEAAVLAATFAALPQVTAVVLGGSRATGVADPSSDVDLYVYAHGEVPVTFRAALAGRRSVRTEIDNRLWETGDEWDDVPAGTRVDVMYRDPAWVEGELSAVLDRHQAKLGFTTCVWHNVLTSEPLFDRVGWFALLQERARRPYPEGLVRAILAKNRPALRGSFSSYRTQIVTAAARGDPVAVNHRTAAFLASYFDVLFAIGRVPHPGEKRLLGALDALLCRPASCASQIERLLVMPAVPDPSRLGDLIDALCDGLDACVPRSVG